MDINSRYIYFDEFENAIDNLEMVLFFLKNIDSDKKWKWIIIALHQSLYSISILANKDYYAVIKPNGYLIDINKSIEHLEKSPNPHYAALLLTEQERKSIKRLIDEFRNEFAHFKPQSWLIERDLFPIILRDTLRVINFIIRDSNRINFSIYDQQKAVLLLDALNNQSKNE